MATRCALWFLAAHPYSRVVTTAPTWSQVKEQLWREIHVAHMRADGFFDGQRDDTRLELAPDWFAIGLSTERPERFSGHHARDLLLVLDEASGVSEDIFEAAETFLTNVGAKVLMIGNASILLGIAVAVVGMFALFMWSDARGARDDASMAAASSSLRLRHRSRPGRSAEGRQPKGDDVPLAREAREPSAGRFPRLRGADAMRP